MSKSQLNSLTGFYHKLLRYSNRLSDITTFLQLFNNENDPRTISVLTPFFISLPLLGTIGFAMTAFTTVSLFGWVLVGDSYLYGKYEEQKRERVVKYFENVSTDKINPLMTHLYRLQDHFARSDVVKVNIWGRFVQNLVAAEKDVDYTPFQHSITWIDQLRQDVYESQLTEPDTKLFIEDLIKILKKVAQKRRASIDVDPYEIYKDDEGYDYVFVG